MGHLLGSGGAQCVLTASAIKIIRCEDSAGSDYFMRHLKLIVGLILIIAAGAMMFGDFKLFKTVTWSDVTKAPAIITRDAGFAYVTMNLNAGKSLKAVATPKESADSILLLFMTNEKFTKYKTGSVTKSEVLAWVEPSGLGQQVSFEQRITTSGDYVVLLHPRKDNGKDPWDNGIPFNLSMEVSEPLDLMLPGTGVAALGIALIVLDVMKNRKQVVRPIPSPPAPSGGVKYCFNCGAQIPADSGFCAECGKAQQ